MAEPRTRARFPEAAPEAPHYESLYLKACRPGGGLGVWVRYTVLKPPGAPAAGSLWCTLFDADAPGPGAHVANVSLPQIYFAPGVLDRLVAKTPGLEAHGGHEHAIPEVPFGSIEQPISFGASADGTSSVTSLLEGVEAKRLTSGDPEYVHLHGVGSEDAPELACGDLVGASRRGLNKP